MPNMADWSQTCAEFRWTALRDELQRGSFRSMNIARLAVDRHAAGPHAGRPALRVLGERSEDVSYRDLAARTNRFANLLAALPVRDGARVFVLTGRRVELYEAVLGSLKANSVVCVLFTAFGPEPLKTRLTIGAAEVLVTTASLYKKKIAPIESELPALRHVLLLDSDTAFQETTRLRVYENCMASASEHFVAPATEADTPALLHFTSGTTGTPKGALHVHDAALMHFMTGRYALDLHEKDIFWCTADPGWVTGMSYGVLAPLLLGVTSIVDSGDFDAERWYRILEQQQVTVWYTAPTALRLLMKAGRELADRYRRPALRLIASVGEPLNAEAVWWGMDVLGQPIHDNWWQTETGGIVMANTPGQPIKPGSMGRPLPGIDAVVVARKPDGSVEPVETAEANGELALRVGWPSMFRTYLNQPERYAKCFAGDLYLSGDLVRRDADGYYWFLGRSDDVIKTSGHLVGPFEIEAVLMEHASVVEAAVIGVPDPVAGESIKAYVVLRTGIKPDNSLRDQLIAHARRRLGPALAPRALAFVDGLPHTRSGKIMRRLLRARELGLPEGDTSALESGA
jgi:acetyl-CoA synthetase